ncbi:hypothetical protein ACO1O0_009385 [Amphichorda felina]
MPIDPSTLDPNDATLWAAPVPPGETRITLDQPTSASGLNAVGIATTVIATLCVAARLFTRIWVVRNVGADDCELPGPHLILISLALALAYLGVIMASEPLGAGNHIWDVPAKNFMDFMKLQLTTAVLYSSSVSFSKLSILAFYLRLSVRGYFRRSVYTLIGVVAVYTVVYEFLMIFQCIPVAKFWNQALKGTCLGRMIPMMVLSVANAVIDLLILLIPLPVVVPLKISTRQKVSLILLFGTGGLVCAATIKRTVILPGLLSAADYTFAVPPQMVWGYVEINAGLLCASVPALKPLFVRYLPFIIASKVYSHSGGGRHSGATPGYGSRRSNHLDALATVGGTKRGSRLAAAQEAYELHSRDDDARAGDEAKLWVDGKGASRAATRGASSDDDDDDSLGSVEGKQYPAEGRVGRSTVVTAWGESDHDRPRLGGGINVTRETKVSYASN